MAIRPIIQYPDPRLRAVAQPVTVFDAALRELAADLAETMQAAPGIGITASHIGVLQRIVVIRLSDWPEARTYINPVILWSSDETFRHLEGSVSMPGVGDNIDRPARVRVQYQDLDGGQQIEEAENLAATCHQHEIDQLDGIFWLQKFSRLKRDRLIKRYEKLQRLSAD